MYSIVNTISHSLIKSIMDTCLPLQPMPFQKQWNALLSCFSPTKRIYGCPLRPLVDKFSHVTNTRKSLSSSCVIRKDTSLKRKHGHSKQDDNFSYLYEGEMSGSIEFLNKAVSAPELRGKHLSFPLKAVNGTVLARSLSEPLLRSEKTKNDHQEGNSVEKDRFVSTFKLPGMACFLS